MTMLIEPIGQAAAAYGAHRASLTPPAASAPTASATPAALTEASPTAGAAAEPSFGAYIDKQITQAVDTLKESEQVSMAAVAGRASAQEVVRSVLAAEMTVQAVVAVRDRMVQAYQEIMRMAI